MVLALSFETQIRLIVAWYREFKQQALHARRGHTGTQGAKGALVDGCSFSSERQKALAESIPESELYVACTQGTHQKCRKQSATGDIIEGTQFHYDYLHHAGIKH
jgi:hypothetical protein